MSILIEELFKYGRDGKESKRGAAMTLIKSLCLETRADLSDHTHQLLIYAVESLPDSNEVVCERAWLTLEAIVSKVTGSLTSY